MFMKCLKVGQMETNCYILCDKINNKAAIIDPGYDAGRIATALEDTECTAEYIILTHAHYDHIAAVHALKQKAGAKLVVYEDELEVLNDTVKNLYTSFGDTSFQPFEPEILVHDRDSIQLGILELGFLHTPGHTSGSCSILCQDCIFTGDTMFREDTGRTDLPTGSEDSMRSSVRRLLALEGEYRVFPGHGDFTTMSHEREYRHAFTSGDVTQ